MQFLTFDDVDISASASIRARQVVGGGTQYAVSHQYQRRSRQHPVLEDVTYNELRIPFQVERDPDVDYSDVLSLFSVYAGFRTLVAMQGETQVTVQVDVAQIGPSSETNLLYDGEFITAGIPEAADASGPYTSSPVTVQGSVEALPTITITGGGVAATRERYSIRDRTGRGLKSWDVRVQESAAQVWVNGVMIPFAVVDVDGTDYTWFRVGVLPNRPTLVDVITGGPESPAKDTLDAGTMVLAESTNTERKYSGWEISKNPGGASNQWRPGVTEPLDRSSIGLTYGVDNEGASQWHARLTGSSVEHHRFSLANDYVSAVFTTPVPITKISGLERIVRRRGYVSRTQLSSTILEPAVTVAQAKVRHKQDEQEEWITSWMRTLEARSLSSDTESDSSDIEFPDGALMVSVTLTVPPLGVTHETGELGQRGEILATYQHQPAADLFLEGEPVVTWRSTEVPEITHMGSVSGRVIESGNLINETTGEELRFDHVYYDEAGLRIDCKKLDINAVTGMHYGTIRETDPAHLFKLHKGENVWNTTGDLDGATVSISLTERYIT